MAVPTPTERTEAKNDRKGGFKLVIICVTVGYTIAGLLAVYTVDIAMAFAPMSERDVLAVNEVPTRLALVVAVAGLIGLAGLTLDALHTGNSPWRDLLVRALALTAGSTAVVGAWGALPQSLLNASTFWVFFVIGSATATFTLVYWLVQLGRSANRKPAAASTTE